MILRYGGPAAVTLCLLTACGGSFPPASASSSTPIDVKADPVQGPAEGVPIELKRGDFTFTVTARASYVIQAEVMSVEDYGSGWNTLLSPVDFALAWGPLTDPAAKEHISYSQSGRWYYYEFDGACPVDQSTIRTHSANVHILPATGELDEAVRAVRAGDRIRLTGRLVSVDGKSEDGQTVWWHSSLTREDEGDGSCEVMWVTEMQRGADVYR